MVGDRLLTDVAMAHGAGMVGALVLTGATSRADLRRRPDGRARLRPRAARPAHP